MLNLKIPKARIEKIKPVIAVKINGKYETMDQVKKRTGCTHIINAGTYNMKTYALDTGLKIDGKVLKAGWHGMGINNGRDLIWSYAGNWAQDYFGAFYDTVRNGKHWHESRMNDRSARGRTGFGYDKDSIYIVSIGDTESQYRCSSTDFMQRYFAGKADFACNLDGGGSSQWITPEKSYRSGRRVLWYICIWIKPETKPAPIAPKPAPVVNKPTAPSSVIHTVKRGETLGSIARKYNTTYTKIAKDNGIKNVNVIKVGQRLTIYPGSK